MTDADRRWAEIKLYYYCLDIYNYRKNLMDVAYAIEIVSQISDEFNQLRMKRIASKVLSLNNIMPTQQEFVVLAIEHGLTTTSVAKKIGKSTAATSRMYNKNKDDLYFLPVLEKEESNEVIKFLKPLDYLQKAGV